MASAPTWFRFSRIVRGSPVESTKHSEIVSPPDAISQEVRNLVSISIREDTPDISLYFLEYSAVGMWRSRARQPWPLFRFRDIHSAITRPDRAHNQGRDKPMSDFNLLIDGKMVAGDLKMPVLNPATEEVLAECPRASKEQLD